jgi:hypothetical protein
MLNNQLINEITFMKKSLKISLKSSTHKMGCPRSFTNDCGINYRS